MDSTATEPMLTDAADGDDALLRRFFQSGERAALGAYFQRHAGRAYRLALCICGDPHRAEEAVQAAFVRVLTVKGEPPRNPSAWLATLVVNACRAEARAEKRRRVREETIAMQQDSATRAGSVPAAVEQTELIATALRTVKGLPEHYRLPVWLHFVENLSFAEVGATLGLSEGTVREQARRGLAHVRETLTAGGMFAAAIHLPELLKATPLPAPPASLLTSLQHAALHGSTAAGSSALAAKAGLSALAKVGLGAAMLLVGAITATRLLPPLTPHQTRGDEAPSPAPKVAPVADNAPAPAVPAPGPRTLEAILASRLEARFRRDYPGEVLRDLEERTGLKFAMPKPIAHAFLFTFEKKDATVKEVLEKLAADGQFQLEYHDPVVAVWKKADDALLTELAAQLKTPAAYDATVRLGALADPRIYPLLFEVIAADPAELGESVDSILYNSHRDCVVYAKGMEQIVTPLLEKIKKIDVAAGSAYLLAAASGDRRFVEPLLEVAKKQKFPSVRSEAAEAVLALGDDRGAPILLELLQSEEKNTAIMAAWELAKTQNQQGFDAVVKLAHSPVNEKRRIAAYTLDNFAGPRARETLLELLEDSDRQTAESAAVALGRFQETRAIAGLVKLVKNDTQEPRQRAWFAFRMNTFFRQLSTAEALGCIVDARALAALKELAHAESAAVRARAAQGLGITRTPEAFALLVELLKDSDAKVRELAVEALGTTRDERAYELLAEHAKDAEAGMRSGAALGLGVSRDPRAFDTLKQLSEDPDKDVRCDSIVGLSLLRDPRATALFAKLARDPEDFVSHTACEALAVSRDPHAADELIACVYDANPQVSKNAKDSLMLAMAGGDQRLMNLNFSVMMKEVKLPKPQAAEPQPKPDAKNKDEF